MEAKYGIFGLSMGQEYKDTVDKVLKSARISLTEYFLVKGCIAAEAAGENSVEAGRDLINEQIRRWNKAAIECDDNWSGLWRTCQSVTRGKKPVRVAINLLAPF